jgi:hypothetical protein
MPFETLNVTSTRKPPCAQSRRRVTNRGSTTDDCQVMHLETYKVEPSQANRAARTTCLESSSPVFTCQLGKGHWQHLPRIFAPCDFWLQGAPTGVRHPEMRSVRQRSIRDSLVICTGTEFSYSTTQSLASAFSRLSTTANGFMKHDRMYSHRSQLMAKIPI